MRPPSLERRYRALLVGYPRLYRREHGDELVGTLLAAATPGRRWPSAREVVDVLRGGLRIRAAWQVSTPRALLAGTLHTALVAALATQLRTTAGSGPAAWRFGFGPLAAVLVLSTAAALVAVLLRRYAWATVGVAGLIAALAVQAYRSVGPVEFFLGAGLAGQLCCVLVTLGVLLRLGRGGAEAPPPVPALLVVSVAALGWPMHIGRWQPWDTGWVVLAVVPFVVVAALTLVDVRLPAGFAIACLAATPPPVFTGPVPMLYPSFAALAVLAGVTVLLGRRVVRL